MDGSDVIGVGLSVKRIQSALVAPFYNDRALLGFVKTLTLTRQSHFACGSRIHLVIGFLTIDRNTIFYPKKARGQLLTVHQ